MRALRNSLVLLGLPVCLGLPLPAIAQSAPNLPAGTPLPANPFLPLTVGSTWSYACSTEGRFQFMKKVRVASMTTAGALKIFQVATYVGKARTPSVTYLSLDAAGAIRTSFNLPPAPSAALLSAAPRPGEQLGNFRVASISQTMTWKGARLATLKLENFSTDDPNLPEEKRLEWLGRTYAKGLGLVEESDGLGGACVLKEYSRPKN